MNSIMCPIFCQFCKKVVLQSSKHGDVIETKTINVRAPQSFLANSVPAASYFLSIYSFFLCVSWDCCCWYNFHAQLSGLHHYSNYFVTYAILKSPNLTEAPYSCCGSVTSHTMSIPVVLIVTLVHSSGATPSVFSIDLVFLFLPFI